MFLNMLNEKEGKNFLELANIAMNVDGVVLDSERAIFETYRMELKLPNYQIVNKRQKEIITEFLASTKKVRKAVIIELAGVLDSDEIIDENEEAWIYKLGIDLGFRNSEIKKMIRWTQDFNDLLTEGYEYINKR